MPSGGGDDPVGTVGWTRFYFADDRWEWSPAVARLHGYAPDAVAPTTELVLSHKHPDDLAMVHALLDRVRQAHQPWSSRHRIIDTCGALHEVVVVGSHLRDDTGRIVGSEGHYVDVTPTLRAADEHIAAAVAEVATNRATIEQAKGMLMLVYRIDADRAFEILRWRSATTNTKVRLLAEQILIDVRALEHGERLPARSVYDHVLLTAHTRIPRGR
ncbi:putative transcription antitermination regulator [Mycolicibacterium anyangense]|uniref:Putative transcription antitermination regulator n=1 Tax=Mycolicibacterium anyangense TaxID=1431246 RepID=A0A6N4W823_9MYCO|nr:PAS and ANTAR domain-containing protein [Mycolicibacterium anyangense]BBZ78140.1 putative transcription antitermination regulator [Mycolicibacterium anyangense]